MTIATNLLPPLAVVGSRTCRDESVLTRLAVVVY